MTNVGIIEAASRAIGTELTKLFGFACTRLTTRANPETQIQSGVNSMNWNGTTTCTLTAGTLSLSVALGKRVRILSGAAKGAEALVQSRDTSTQLTLQAAFPNQTTFSGASFEIVTDADTALLVESTLEFAEADAPGRLVMDGQVYLYSGKTYSSFTGIQHDDGTGVIVDGVAAQHEPLTIISDFSKATSALDQYRRSFLIDYSSGEDLSVLGRNLGVERPPELTDDELYRGLIKAVAYAPRGTIYAMEGVLDALLGETSVASGTKTATSSGTTIQISSGTFPTGIEGMRFRVTSGAMKDQTIRIASRTDATHIVLNKTLDEAIQLQSWTITDPNWEIFEDLTLGSIHHGCSVFFRRTDDAETAEMPYGKAFLDGEDYKPATSGTVIPATGLGRLKVASIRLKDEGGPHLIAQSDATHLASSSDSGVTVTGPAATFNANIFPGDIFEVMSGPYAGRLAMVVSRASATSMTLGLVAGAMNLSQNSLGTLGVNIAGVAWRVYRYKTECRFYKPNTEVRIEYPGDTGTTIWTFNGTNVATQVDVTVDSTHGARMRFVPAATRCLYRRVTRITPEANAELELLADIPASPSSSATSGKQFCAYIMDGERTLAWGIIDDVSTLQTYVGFISMVSGSFIGTTPKQVWGHTANTKYSPGLNAIRIVKTARGTVRLYRQAWQGASHATTNWELIDELAYASFPTTAAWIAAAPYTPDAHEMAFGTCVAGFSGNSIVRYVDWNVQNVVEFMNYRSAVGATTTAEALVDSTNTPFLVGDVGKKVRIRDIGAVNSGGGNTLGLWEVGAYTSNSTITLIGETKYRGGFLLDNLSWFVVRGDPEAFIWPDVKGHSIQILDGVNAGIYAISAVIDPLTGLNVELAAPLGAANSSTWTSVALQDYKERSMIVLLDTAGGSPAKPSGFTLTDTECSWRLVPNFPTDAAVTYELVEAATDSSGTVTLRQTTGFAAGTVIAIHVSKVLSAYLNSEREHNALLDDSPLTYQAYPFYLYDGFGYVRIIMDIVRAAGMYPDFDKLFVDAAGRHLLEV